MHFVTQNMADAACRKPGQFYKPLICIRKEDPISLAETVFCRHARHYRLALAPAAAPAERVPAAFLTIRMNFF